jgi:hypothetical protein
MTTDVRRAFALPKERRPGWLTAVTVVLLCALAFTHRADAECRTILMVDDHDILYRSGTERISHPAQRHSDKAIIAAEKPWDRMIGYASVYRDPQTGKYQLWYQAYSGARSGELKLKCVVAYAESDDGDSERQGISSSRLFETGCHTAGGRLATSRCRMEDESVERPAAGRLHVADSSR